VKQCESIRHSSRNCRTCERDGIADEQPATLKTLPIEMAVDARRLFIGILAKPPVKFMRIIWSTRDEAVPERRRVVVIGAGVVGVMSAYGLSRRGFEVTVLDAMSGPAEMCSQGNAGIMAIGHAKAWAGPDALPAMVKAFAGRDPSVKISRLNDPALWWWGAEFLANCTSTAHHRNTEALQQLSRYSRDLLLDAQIKMDLPMEVRSNGGLYIFQDQAQFESYKASIQKHGNDELTVLERDELISREAGLSGFSDRLVGGIYSASDAVGDCRLFTERTVAYLENSKGVEFRFGTAVTGFRCSTTAAEAVKTNRGEIECGAVVLATGVETCDLTRSLGFSPNIYPVKGYSGTWKVTDLATAPLIKGEWVRRGTHIDLIGGFTPKMREADDAALKMARTFVDTSEALHEAGDLVQPIQDGVVASDHILGTLADLASAKLDGRTSADEITYFKAVGSALADLVAAQMVFSAVRS